MLSLRPKPTILALAKRTWKDRTSSCSEGFLMPLDDPAKYMCSLVASDEEFYSCFGDLIGTITNSLMLRFSHPGNCLPVSPAITINFIGVLTRLLNDSSKNPLIWWLFHFWGIKRMSGRGRAYMGNKGWSHSERNRGDNHSSKRFSVVHPLFPASYKFHIALLLAT